MIDNILKFNKDYKFFDFFERVEYLPNKVLVVNLDPFGNPYLTEDDDFVVPTKVYSNDAEFITHVLNYWQKTDKPFGVLLEGKKGLGKSFTAKLICIKLGIPIIKITQQINHHVFTMLNKIKQEHVIFIDEFEKTFDQVKNKQKEVQDVTQEDFLSFLDGSNTNNTKRLFMVTVNNSVNSFLLNRPTRIRYVRNYELLEDNIIEEVINDKLLDKQFLPDLIDNIEREELNLDCLIEIIHEINITGRPYSEFKDFFNYQIEKNNYEFYLIKEDKTLELLDTAIHPAGYTMYPIIPFG